MTPRSVVIVGAGLAGSRCAETLRAEGFDGQVTLVGDEPLGPYERPALSKQFLAGTKERIELRPPSHWEERDIKLCSAGAWHASCPEWAKSRAPRRPTRS